MNIGSTQPPRSRAAVPPTGHTKRLARALLACLVCTPITSAAALTPLPLPETDAITRLEPLLSSGDVLFLEAAGGGSFRQATVFSQIPTSAAKAYALIAEPMNNQRMSPSVDSVTVQKRATDGALYTSTVRVPFGSVSTQIQMTYQPPDTIVNRMVGGDIPTGDFRWRFIPESSSRSSVVYSLRTDIRESSWFVRQVVRSRPELQFGGNAGTGLITVWGLKRLALNQPVDLDRKAPAPWADRPVELPLRLVGDVSRWAGLMPLLERGVLVHVECTPGGRMKRVTVYGRLRAPRSTVYELTASPERYPRFMSNLKSLEVLERSSSRIRYKSDLEMMMMHFRQTEVVTLTPGQVRQEVVEGDLAGSASLFEMLPLDERNTLVAYSIYMDPTRAGWLMKKIFALDPLIEHIMGVSAAFNIFHGLAREAQKSNGPGQSVRPPEGSP